MLSARRVGVVGENTTQRPDGSQRPQLRCALSSAATDRNAVGVIAGQKLRGNGCGGGGANRGELRRIEESQHPSTVGVE